MVSNECQTVKCRAMVSALVVDIAHTEYTAVLSPLSALSKHAAVAQWAQFNNTHSSHSVKRSTAHHHPEHSTLGQAFSVTSELSVNNKSPPCCLTEHIQMTSGNHGCGQDTSAFTFIIVVPSTDAVSALIKNKLKVLGQQHQTACSTIAALGRLHSFKLRWWIMQLKCILFLPATHTHTPIQAEAQLPVCPPVIGCK